MRSLIVFAGAGASRGVSEQKYPMALDFRKRLPAGITDSHLFGQLYQHLMESGLGEGVDIEHVLWELGRLHEAIEEWTDAPSFASKLLTTNQIGVIASSNNSGPAISGQLHNLKGIVTDLQDQINEQVYGHYSQQPSSVELERSWIPLLEQIANSNFDRIDVFTTNYDLVIEFALEQLRFSRVSMGFREGIYPGINLDAWRSQEPSAGLLTKLHGSVDWKLGSGSTDVDPVIRRGHPEFDGDHGKRLILYPGFKGVPSREPFVSFHDYLRRRSREATHLLFVGFAFRDDYINNLIATAMPPTSYVAVVNPTPDLPGLPFLSNALHLRKGFGIDKQGTLLTTGGIEPLELSDLKDWIEQK